MGDELVREARARAPSFTVLGCNGADDLITRLADEIERLTKEVEGGDAALGNALTVMDKYRDALTPKPAASGAVDVEAIRECERSIRRILLPDPNDERAVDIEWLRLKIEAELYRLRAALNRSGAS